MADKLIRVDYERGKAIVMRTITNDDGTNCVTEVEIDLPQAPMSEGKIRKVKRDADGRMYETEEIIRFPLMTQTDNKEEE